MRFFACKDLDGHCSVIESESDPTNQENFAGSGDRWRYMELDERAEPYCRDLAPGTFRELKKLDVVSGEFEFVEEVKVPTLREAWEAYRSQHPSVCFPSTNTACVGSWRDLAAAIDRELAKPAPRYDEKLIDELLEVGKDVTLNLSVLLTTGNTFNMKDNRRAAEILQALKRAKEGA